MNTGNTFLIPFLIKTNLKLQFFDKVIISNSRIFFFKTEGNKFISRRNR